MGFVRVWYRHCGVRGVPLCGGCLVRELCGVDVPNHIVCVFHSINLSVHTFHRMFPVSLNITLKQFHDITNICGYIPCPCFKATLSLNALFSATCNTIVAIEETKKLVVTIANAHNGQSIYCAFEIISLPQEQTLSHTTSFRLGLFSNAGQAILLPQATVSQLCNFQFIPVPTQNSPTWLQVPHWVSDNHCLWTSHLHSRL